MLKRKTKKQKPLCESCRVLNFGSCPNLIALHDNGFIDPPVRRCAWKEFFDNLHTDIRNEAIRAGLRGNQKWRK